jgi:hypothetical protein
MATPYCCHYCGSLCNVTWLVSRSSIRVQWPQLAYRFDRITHCVKFLLHCACSTFNPNHVVIHCTFLGTHLLHSVWLHGMPGCDGPSSKAMFRFEIVDVRYSWIFMPHRERIVLGLAIHLSAVCRSQREAAVWTLNTVLQLDVETSEPYALSL